MRRRRTSRSARAVLLAACVSTACGADSKPPAPYVLTTDQVAAWAPNVSALGAYLSIYQPLASHDGRAVFTDPACPAVERDETTLSITGGCTDSSGLIWTGSVTMDLATNVLTFAAFGSGHATPVSGTQSGEASISDSSTTSRDFSIQLSGSDGSSIDYQGHVEGAYDARTVWNGSGTFVRHTGQTNGEVDATTSDEVYDDAQCSSQPAAGTTQLTLHDHVAVVTYDGAVDCGGDGAAVTIDGDPRGTIPNVACSLSPKAGTTGAWGTRFTLLLAVAGAWLARRIRRRTAANRGVA